MARYVHPSVRDIDRERDPSVTLVIVPKEGTSDRVQAKLHSLSATVEERSLGMLEVSVPTDAISEIVNMEDIRSVSSADVSMGDLSTGNPNSPQM